MLTSFAPSPIASVIARQLVFTWANITRHQHGGRAKRCAMLRCAHKATAESGANFPDMVVPRSARWTLDCCFCKLEQSQWQHKKVKQGNRQGQSSCGRTRRRSVQANCYAVPAATFSKQLRTTRHAAQAPSKFYSSTLICSKRNVFLFQKKKTTTKNLNQPDQQSRLSAWARPGSKQPLCTRGRCQGSWTWAQGGGRTWESSPQSPTQTRFPDQRFPDRSRRSLRASFRGFSEKKRPCTAQRQGQRLRSIAL